MYIWYRNASYYYYLRQGGYVFVVVFPSVCLSVCLLATLHNNFRMDLHEIFTEVWQWANEQMIKFWWRSGSPSGHMDCFPDSSLLGDTESGINRLRCATLQCTACTSRHQSTMTSLRHRPRTDSGSDIATLVRRTLAEVCTVPVLLVCFCYVEFSFFSIMPTDWLGRTSVN